MRLRRLAAQLFVDVEGWLIERWAPQRTEDVRALGDRVAQEFQVLQGLADQHGRGDVEPHGLLDDGVEVGDAHREEFFDGRVASLTRGCRVRLVEMCTQHALYVLAHAEAFDHEAQDAVCGALPTQHVSKERVVNHARGECWRSAFLPRRRDLTRHYVVNSGAVLRPGCGLSCGLASLVDIALHDAGPCPLGLAYGGSQVGEEPVKLWH